MKGLTVDSVRKHPSLIPLYGALVFGCLAAGYYVFRLATKCPDVSWTRKYNGEPWQAYTNKQYKFYDIGDMKDIVQPPKF